MGDWRQVYLVYFLPRFSPFSAYKCKYRSVVSSVHFYLDIMLIGRLIVSLSVQPVCQVSDVTCQIVSLTLILLLYHRLVEPLRCDILHT